MDMQTARCISAFDNGNSQDAQNSGDARVSDATDIPRQERQQTSEEREKEALYNDIVGSYDPSTGGPQKLTFLPNKIKVPKRGYF